MKLSPEEVVLLYAWMASRNTSEVVRRMAGLLTGREVKSKVRHFRRAGVLIPSLPGAVAGDTPVTLTPHPEGDGVFLDGRGRVATPIGPEAPAGFAPDGDGPPEEGPWRCVACRRLASGGWCLVSPDATRRFACGRCVTLVGDRSFR
jgi:hypothetical protein